MADLTICVQVPGQPVPKARPRVVRGRTYTDSRTVAYESLVTLHCQRAAGLWRRAQGQRWPMDSRYTVLLHVARSDRRACDLDNVAKSILDGAIGVLWDDDARIDDLRVVRCASDAAAPYAHLRVTTSGGAK